MTTKFGRDEAERTDHGGAMASFDADTGALLSFSLPTGEHAGRTITAWLKALHMALVLGLRYRIFV